MTKATSPKVAIVMGSDSDWSTMKNCADMLEGFGVPFEARIMSAHRTPGQTADFADKLGDSTIQVVIAAAGMAAHLAGVIAAHTTLPVIGVPMASGALQGVDALLSTVQMPGGIPVATVGIGSAGAKNAAVLAVQILACEDAALAQKLAEHKEQIAQAVRLKDQQLQEQLASRSQS